jgi:hypothetical protein
VDTSTHQSCVAELSSDAAIDLLSLYAASPSPRRRDPVLCHENNRSKRPRHLVRCVSSSGQIPWCGGRIQSVGVGGLAMGNWAAFAVGVSSLLLLKMFLLQF